MGGGLAADEPDGSPGGGNVPTLSCSKGCRALEMCQKPLTCTLGVNLKECRAYLKNTRDVKL